MSRISDLIARFINELIEQGDGVTEIQRNEMASYFDCAPSQINYVLMTRFTTEQGYYIESRRGGGGCIRITRIEVSKDDYLLNILSKGIGDSINKESAFNLIEALYKRGLIEKSAIRILKAAVDDSTLSTVQKPFWDKLRADVLKAVIVAAVMD